MIISVNNIIKSIDNDFHHLYDKFMVNYGSSGSGLIRSFLTNEPGHNGIIRYASNATYGSSYLFTNLNHLILNGNEVINIIFRTQHQSNHTTKIGFTNSFDVDGVSEGCYLRICDDEIFLRCKHSGGTSDGTPTFLHTDNVWYYANIVVNNYATSVTCKIYKISDGSLVYTGVINNNIPKNQPLGFGISVKMYEDFSTELIDIDYLSLNFNN